MDCRHERGRSSPRPKIGFIAVLHTWTQTLMYHPHIHCIVTGGGPNKDRWIRSRDDFFLPVRVMARLFRGKFLDELRKAEDLPTLDRHTLDHLYKRDWVVYCKPPFGSPKHVLAYLGRYTHRIAISNARITDIDNDRVRFRYRDPDRPGQSRSMDLPPSEFLRRFLTHVLPSGFVKIRYYGLLANRSRQEDLKRCRRLLLVETPTLSKEPSRWQQILLDRTGVDVSKCPFCEQGKLVLVRIIQPAAERAPPALLT